MEFLQFDTSINLFCLVLLTLEYIIHILYSIEYIKVHTKWCGRF